MFILFSTLLQYCNLDIISAPFELEGDFCYQIEKGGSPIDLIYANDAFSISTDCTKGRNTFDWDMGNDGNVEYFGESLITHKYEKGGAYDIRITAEDRGVTIFDTIIQLQVTTRTFIKRLGGQSPDAGQDVLELNNGNIVVSGYGEKDAYLINGENGSVLNSFDGNGANYWFDDLLKLPNDEVIACGFKGRNPFYGVIVKFNPDLTFHKELLSNNQDPSYDFLMSMVQTSDGDITLKGSRGGIPLLVKVSPSLNHYGGTFLIDDFKNASARPLIYTSTANYLYTVYDKNNSSNTILIKTQPNTIVDVGFEWSTSLGEFGCFEIIEAKMGVHSGKYILVGKSNNDRPTVRIISPQKQNIGTYSLNSEEGNFSSIVSTESGYILMGTIMTEGGDRDILMLKTDLNLNINTPIFKIHHGTNFDEFGAEIISSADGGFVLVGGSKDPNTGENDYYIIKTNHEGELN